MKRTGVMLWIALLVCARATGWAGNFSSYAVVGNTVTFQLSGSPATVRLVICREDIIRVMITTTPNLFNPDSLYENYRGPYLVVRYSWEPVPFNHVEHADRVDITTARLLVRCWKNPFRIQFCTPTGVVINEDEGPTSINTVKRMFLDEHFYGFATGQHSGDNNQNFRPGPLDYRGRAVTTGRVNCAGGGCSQANFFMSTRGYGISLPTFRECTYDFTSSTTYRFTGGMVGPVGPHREYYFYYGPSFRHILNLYTQVTGRPGFLPKYYYGIIHSDDDWRMPTEWVSYAEQIRQRQMYGDQIRTDNEPTWSNPGGAKNAYNEIRHVVNDLKYQFSFWIMQYHTDPTQDSQYGSGVPKDVSDPRWINWFFNHWHQSYWDVGVVNYKVDGCDWTTPPYEEMYPITHLLQNGPPIDDTHYSRFFIFTKHVYDRTAVKSGGRGACFMRFGFGTHRFPTIWDGDEGWPDFGPRIVRNHLSMGLSGFATYSFDIMDYFQYTHTDEQILRQLAFGMLSPVPCMYSGQILSYSTTAVQGYRKYARLRYRLMPYIYSTAWQASQTGTPMMRALVIDYPDDPRCQQENLSYLFGEYLYVAPVPLDFNTLSKTHTDFYLPAGTWYDWWNGRKSTGPVMVRNYPVPIDLIPIFVKAGAIIPMGPDMQYVDEKPTDPLTLEIWPHGTSSFEMYEDNGGHRAGWERHTVTTFTCIEQAQSVRVDYAIADHGLGISSRTYIYHIRWYDKPGPTEVTANGTPLTRHVSTAAFDAAPSGWYLDVSSSIVRVKSPGSAASLSIIVAAGSVPPNQLPTVALTSPVNNSTYTAPAVISIAATASDPDGTIANVRFYAGTTLLNLDTTSPYSHLWANVSTGSYSLRAVAQDNVGATSTSAVVTVTVYAPNQAPTVALTSPVNNSTYTAPANIVLGATATDPDGTVAHVRFYRGTTLLNTDSTSPYTYTWSNVSSGTYQLRAVAQDNAGATSTSTIVTVTVLSSSTPAVWYALVSSVVPAGSGVVSPASGTYLAGSQITLTAIPSQGYVFVGWGGDASGDTPIVTITMDGNKSVTASFALPLNSSPTVPTGLRAVSVGRNAVSIAWDASTDPDDEVAGYHVYRNGSLLGSVISTAFTDSGLTAGTTYQYTVRAFDTFGNTSELSAPLVVVTESSAPPVVVVQAPFGGVPHPVPGRIELEHYDTGGEGVAFHCLGFNGMHGNDRNYRFPDPTGIGVLPDGGRFLGWLLASEWYEYTINVTHSGRYRMVVRAAAVDPGNTIRLELDGVRLTDSIRIAPSGGWTIFSTGTIGSVVTLPAGEHVLRVCIETGGYNIDYIEFLPETPQGICRVLSGSRGYLAPGESATVQFNPQATGTVSVKVFTLTGTLIWNTSVQASAHESAAVTWTPPADLSSGVYILDVSGAGIKKRTKIALVR